MTFVEKISEKNISFLIGSGASYPLYKTLEFYTDTSFEEIISNEKLTKYNNFLEHLYFFHWIKDMYDDVEGKKEYTDVYNKYKMFLEKLILFLTRESKGKPNRINIFTTNYDMMFEKAFDDIQKNNPFVYFNDGSSGFIKRTIMTHNYYKQGVISGITNNFQREIPNINLFKIHGSLSWELDEKENINVNYNKDLTKLTDSEIKAYEEYLKDVFSTIGEDLNIEELISCFEEYFKTSLTQQQSNGKELFKNWIKRNNLIINPNKWKFNQTVMEKHYYELLRSFSYELEKKQSILIVLGFSFADEHILDVTKRALNNDELLMYLIAYSKDDKIKYMRMFEGYDNVIILPENNSSNPGDFNYLNEILSGRE